MFSQPFALWHMQVCQLTQARKRHFRLVFSSSLGDQPPKSPLFCPYRLKREAQVLLVSLPTPVSRQRSIHLVRVYVLSLFPGTRISSPT